MPIGKLFYFVPKVSTGAEALNGKNNTDNGSLPPTPGSPDASTYESKSLYDLYYNDGLFDRSKGAATMVTATGSGPVTDAVKFVTLGSDGTYSDVADGDIPAALAADDSVRYAKICVSGFSSAGAGKLIDTRGNEMDTEEFLASLKVTTDTAIIDNDGKEIVAADAEVPFRLVTQKYGSQVVEYADICDADGRLYLELDLTHPACVDCDSGRIDGYTGAESGLTTSGQIC
jgi:hypothetical protein